MALDEFAEAATVSGRSAEIRGEVIQAVVLGEPGEIARIAMTGVVAGAGLQTKRRFSVMSSRLA